MTDIYNSLTVALEDDIRSDDAEQLINAIQLCTGVLSVTGNIVDINAFTAAARVKAHLRGKLMEMLEEGTL